MKYRRRKIALIGTLLAGLYHAPIWADLTEGGGLTSGGGLTETEETSTDAIENNLTEGDNLTPDDVYSGNALTVQNLAPASADISCKSGDVCRQVSTSLPLRGLPRPFSTLYADASDISQVVASNVKAFWPVYIFDRKDLDFSDPANPKGWYQVGTMVKDPMGWMQAKDILEWKQSLVVSYTHPGTGDDRRQSVLMFKTKEDLSAVVESDESTSKVGEIYVGLNAQPMSVPDSVISREPARFVNIEEKFYMLPVIDFEKLDLFDDEARYLQIAAAIPNSRADEGNSDTLQNKEFAELAGTADTTAGTQASELSFDIKFVMDMTGSMQPYIESTKNAIQKVAELVHQKNADAKVNYGLIGYRDDTKVIPELKFVAKNFTEQLVDADGFVKVISTAKAAETGSKDYQEEVFAGVKEAINSQWNENSVKIIILVGDASSHQVGHPQNTSGLDAQQVRELANAKKISIISVHLKEKQAQPDHALAQAQFTQLGTNSGMNAAAYMDVSTDDQNAFGEAVKSIAGELSTIIAEVRQGNIASIKNAPAANTTASAQNAGQKGKQIAQSVAAAALVDYLGSAANPPRDITAWVMDRDLTSPDIRSLDVRVLLKRRELNDLIQALESVLKAVKRSELTQMAFFDALQGVVTQSTKGNQITMSGAQKLADSGLMPDWINSLPYKSAILKMSNDMFAELTADERAALEYEIEGKLELYRIINENNDLWGKLDDRDANIDHVYPLSLSALP